MDDSQVRKDAQALLRFLLRRGVVAGDAGALPSLACQGTALEAVDFVKAPHAGLLVHKRALGERVRAGDVVSRSSIRWARRDQHARNCWRAPTVIFARSVPCLVRSGERVMKIAGKEKLESDGGTLLGD